jgi:hypothetical protein
MATWGVVPSLSHVIRVAACPTCHSLDKARRPLSDFLPSMPGLGGSFWDIPVTLKDVRSSKEAGCQFCEILDRIFRQILSRNSDEADFADVTVNVVVPVSHSYNNDFRVIFKYKATQPGTDLMLKKSKGFHLAVAPKRTVTIVKLAYTC